MLVVVSDERQAAAVLPSIEIVISIQLLNELKVMPHEVTLFVRK